ncbi:lymphocyte cytosolic protein 2 L homeolog [Sesbania bispinosa]|nr:lymphocyte cytosolic protein 2 L homeolog [Sesbania bispinosa]
MVLTRAGVKALVVERRRRCIVVTEEVEDPSIPDLVPRCRDGPKPDDLWNSNAYTVDFQSLSKGEQKTAEVIVKFVEQHRILDCKSVIKKGGLVTRDLLVEMASRQYEKLAERKAKKALRGSQKMSEAPESETDVADQNSKRIKVAIPRLPPPSKQANNLSKGSSSTSLGEVPTSEQVDSNPQGDVGPQE